MKKIKVTLFAVLIAVVSQVVFTACNTAHGFGEDMENAGQKVQDKTSQ